jgi:ribonuclease E
MGNTIVSFEDFQKKSKSGLKEDTIMPTGNSTVFVDGGEEEHHSGEEKNYMFFKNLYTMKKCIEEIMAMDKEQVDEMIEKGHDWASDHISSSKDDLQEVCDWLRYEIDNYESGEDDDDDEPEIEVDDIEIDPEDDDDEDDDDEDDEDDDDSQDEEEEHLPEAKEPKYSYTEEKN